METITLQKTTDKIIETLLLSFLFIFPFTYDGMNFKQIILFFVLMAIIIFLFLTKRRKPTRDNSWKIIFAFLFMLIFDLSEKVNFIQQFSMPIEISWRIPLSTLVLALAMVAYLIQTLVTNKISIPQNPFARYFLFACLLLLILTGLFYPLLNAHYQMKMDFDIQLLNNIFKYSIILILVTKYIKDETIAKRLGIGFIASFCLTMVLVIIF